MDKSSSLGMPMHPNKKTRSTSVKSWGCPRGTPSSSAKIRSPKTLFLLLHALCVFLGAYLLLLSVLFCFAFCNKWLDRIMFVLERNILHFSLPRTLQFSLFLFNEYSLFLLLRLAFVFRLDFCSDLFIYLHQGVFRPLVYVGFQQKGCFKKV
jgi:hypothetical protein